MAHSASLALPGGRDRLVVAREFACHHYDVMGQLHLVGRREVFPGVSCCTHSTVCAVIIS